MIQSKHVVFDLHHIHNRASFFSEPHEEITPRRKEEEILIIFLLLLGALAALREIPERSSEAQDFRFGMCPTLVILTGLRRLLRKTASSTTRRAGEVK